MGKIKNILIYALGAETAKNSLKTREGKVFSTIVRAAVQRTRTDIGNWRTALKAAETVDNPSRVKLYNIYDDALIDALLTSQIENRKQKTLGANFELIDASGKVNDEATAILANSTWFNALLSDFLDTIWWGYSLFEFEVTPDGLNYNLIPRKHVKPLTGEVLAKESDTKGTLYRQTPEYGTWLIEAGAPDEMGLLNKSVPHVLMKRFAQSCWSEHCEINGMPTRVLKTNTQDPEMMRQAQIMMEQMGAAGWAIIDDAENLEFADAMTTNGDVYNALIRLCNNELSLLNNGAIIGQDTQFGSRGKEVSSLQVLDDLVKADKKLVEIFATSRLLPALYRMGVLPDGLALRYITAKDVSAQWKMVSEALPYYDIDPAYIENEFGIPVKPRTNTNTIEQGIKGKKAFR